VSGYETNESVQIRLALQGDEAAWGALVRAHQEPVFRFAYLQLQDADDAEDVAQETFLRASRARNRFDPTRPLRPWLLSITANLARNRRRSAGRYMGAVKRWLQGEESAATTIEEKAEQHWMAESLWKAVQQLSAGDQQIIYLRFFLELSRNPGVSFSPQLDCAPAWDWHSLRQGCQWHHDQGGSFKRSPAVVHDGDDRKCLSRFQW
jgi:RNA polymerase sigma-70 factor, ECF subfamily